MHIQLNLTVTLNEEQRPAVYEALRTQLRRAAQHYVFEAAESAGIFHRDIEIDGDITLEEPVYVDHEPQISYAHREDLLGLTRYVQYAKDPVPGWAVDVKPHQG